MNTADDSPFRPGPEVRSGPEREKINESSPHDPKPFCSRLGGRCAADGPVYDSGRARRRRPTRFRSSAVRASPASVSRSSRTRTRGGARSLPQNLAIKRPKPPFDLTSTWFVDLTRAFADFRFGPPYPEFYEPGQTALKEAAAAAKAGQRYRDSIGECYPAGMPMIMTRVWPISMVQLPTVIYMMFGFNNSIRIILPGWAQAHRP